VVRERCQWSVAFITAERDVAGEHRALLDAALGRDASRSVALLVAHLRATQSRLVQPALAANARSVPSAAAG
jgi:DNA-binding GntR family transcriptional regulator